MYPIKHDIAVLLSIEICGTIFAYLTVMKVMGAKTMTRSIPVTYLDQISATRRMTRAIRTFLRFRYFLKSIFFLLIKKQSKMPSFLNILIREFIPSETFK